MTPNQSEILSSVRDELLGEALSSPGLLADLANLERYIAETYSARSFIELLQNADDAGATRFMVTRHGQWLICANNGRAFSRQDFYSLCRSASSAKQRGQTIGYRGIGFKSVVGVATSVHLLSGELCATFSRELTQQSLGHQTPAPLVRVPHPLDLAKDDAVLEFARQLETSGYSTCFVLGGLDAERVQDEFDQFDADYLLFLRHIEEGTLTGDKVRTYYCQRRQVDGNSREISINGPERRSSWRIEQVGSCDIAYSLVSDRPVPLNAVAAIAHAFLPTLEQTGFGVRINADFSTDPSRTRIIFDDTTLACIEDAAKAIATTISNLVLSTDSDKSVLACLTPTADLATLALQKRSFRTELIARVKKNLETLKDKVTLAPNWLNSPDAQNLATSLKRAVFVPSAAQGDQLSNFMRYLGVKALTAETVIKAAETVQLSPKGCAELVAHCVRNAASGISLRQLADKPVWHGGNSSSPVSLAQLTAEQVPLDQGVIATINAAGVSSNELGRMLKTAGLRDESISRILPGVDLESPQKTVHLPTQAQGASETTGNTESVNQLHDPLLLGAIRQHPPAAPIVTSRSLPAWRSAEQHVASMLGEHGYRIEDRSRQNLGYDLYAEKEGRKYYVEVKLLDYAGQPFIITSNEEVVARECGDNYAIALVLRDSENNVNVKFVHNPTQNMKFIRQCRQWVWECSEYKY